MFSHKEVYNYLQYLHLHTAFATLLFLLLLAYTLSTTVLSKAGLHSFEKKAIHLSSKLCHGPKLKLL